MRPAEVGLASVQRAKLRRDLVPQFPLMRQHLKGSTTARRRTYSVHALSCQASPPFRRSFVSRQYYNMSYQHSCTTRPTYTSHKQDCTLIETTTIGPWKKDVLQRYRLSPKMCFCVQIHPSISTSASASNSLRAQVHIVDMVRRHRHSVFAKLHIWTQVSQSNFSHPHCHLEVQQTHVPS